MCQRWERSETGVVRQRRSEGARERRLGSKGAREQGSEGAREQGSKGAREQQSTGQSAQQHSSRKATKQRSDRATERQSNTTQQSNSATEQQSNNATTQQSNKATTQQSNRAPDVPGTPQRNGAAGEYDPANLQPTFNNPRPPPCSSGSSASVRTISVWLLSTAQWIGGDPASLVCLSNEWATLGRRSFRTSDWVSTAAQSAESG
jgi:hypothetical protein